MKAITALNYGKNILKDVPNGNHDALELLSIATKISTSILLTDCEISSEAYSKYTSLISRRIAREPMDSIIGYTEFCGIKVMFNANTLTPRKETELLTDLVIKELQKRNHDNNKNIKVLDLCCGSGCIGVSIAKHLNASVTCADISEHALKHTKETAEINGAKVQIKKSDMLKNITDKYNIIVCNPPYIDNDDMQKLEIEVKDYDPSLALFGGDDGMDFYKYLATNAHKNLTTNGKMFLEIDHKNAHTIKSLFEKNFKVKLLKDYYNNNRYLVVY